MYHKVSGWSILVISMRAIIINFFTNGCCAMRERKSASKEKREGGGDLLWAEVYKGVSLLFYLLFAEAIIISVLRTLIFWNINYSEHIFLDIFVFTV